MLKLWRTCKFTRVFLTCCILTTAFTLCVKSTINIQLIITVYFSNLIFLRLWNNCYNTHFLLLTIPLKNKTVNWKLKILKIQSKFYINRFIKEKNNSFLNVIVKNNISIMYEANRSKILQIFEIIIILSFARFSITSA